MQKGGLATMKVSGIGQERGDEVMGLLFGFAGAAEVP